MAEPASTGTLLRQYRLHAGLTQDELSVQAGLSVRAIRDLESGKVRRPRGSSLRLLAKALDVRPEDLGAAEPETGGLPPSRRVQAMTGLGSQLPAGLADFTGRTRARARLTELLSVPAGVPLAVIHGRPGVGKTALAVQVAHDVRPNFPDGQLFVRLGSDQPLGPAEVLDRFLRMLGVEGSAIPPTLDERAAEFRALLSDRRVLVVLDDATAETQVRPLLPGTAGNAVIVTSRAPLAGLLSANSVALDGLDQEQSLALLSRIAGGDRVGAEGEAAARIVVDCAGLPLALRIAGARARETPLGHLADALADENRRLEELTTGDAAVRASFTVGYGQLDGLARRAYRLLGWLRVPDVPVWAVTALLDVGDATAQAAVHRLVTAAMLESSGRGARSRYRLHDLLRLDARERAEVEDAPAARAAAVRRALSGWLVLADQADRRLPSDAVALLDRVPQDLGRKLDRATAEAVLEEPLGWFEYERMSLVPAVQLAAVQAPDLVAGLADSLIDFYATRDYTDDWEAVADLMLQSAQTTSDDRLIGHAHRRLAELALYRGDPSVALDRASAAIARAEAVGDIRDRAAARLAYGSALRVGGRPADARTELRACEAEFLAAGDEHGAGHACSELGMAALALGDLDGARVDLGVAVARLSRTGDVRGHARALLSQGSAANDAGDQSTALVIYRQAGDLFRSVDDRGLTVIAAVQAGRAQLSSGDAAGARDALLGALAKAKELHRQDSVGVASLALGQAHLELGDRSAALEFYTEARTVFTETGMAAFAGAAEAGQGDVALAEGDVFGARERWESALKVLDQASPPRAEVLRARLADLPA